jgi:transposase
MNWDAEPSGKRGRSRTFSDAAIQTCLTMKVLFGMALRQTTGFVGSLLQLTGLDWDVPDFSTICRRLKTLSANIPYRGAKGPLHLLIRFHGLQANHCWAVDSTGIKVEGDGEWNARKHGGPKRCVWRKIYIGIDEQTLEIRAVEITGSNTGDAPMLPHLLNQIPRDQHIGSVTADGAYDTRRCHNAIADLGANAVIPPRRNAQPWKPTTAGTIARNDALRAPRSGSLTLWQ